MTPGELRRHLLDELVPLWHAHGVDREWGGFHGRLDHRLDPVLDDPKRLLVQARQLYVFSSASLAGAPPFALEAAREGFAFLCERFRDARHGGWVLTTTRGGEPLDGDKDTYAHAFVIFALAHYGRASREPRALELAAETFGLLERHLADPECGGFAEAGTCDWKPVRGPRHQNPHMHLLEALLALHAATGEERYVARCLELHELLRARFVDPERGCLLEHFDAGWQPHPERGRSVEPGHHFEWTALLHQLAAASGRAEPLAAAEGLFAFAARHGLDEVHGGVYDELEPDGTVVRDTKRLWPQLEYARALAARTGSDPAARGALEGALAQCFTRYVDPAHRGWREHAARDGSIVSTHLRATSAYHVWGALSAAADALEADGAG